MDLAMRAVAQKARGAGRGVVELIEDYAPESWVNSYKVDAAERTPDWYGDEGDAEGLSLAEVVKAEPWIAAFLQRLNQNK